MVAIYILQNACLVNSLHKQFKSLIKKGEIVVGGPYISEFYRNLERNFSLRLSLHARTET